MPLVTVDGLRHYYRLTGPSARPVLMMSHSLGLDHGMWDPQAVDLERHLQVLRYDLRGHGGSDAPPGDYSIAGLARDALGIADALGLRTIAFCGLSIGGMIGQWIAANEPERRRDVTQGRVSDVRRSSARHPDTFVSSMGSVVRVFARRNEDRGQQTAPSY